MKTINVIGSLVIAIGILSSCNRSETDNSTLLDAAQFDNMIQTTPDKIILDVRTPEEFAEGHIQDAVLINFKDSDFTQKINELDKSKTLLVYCASGIRSGKAYSLLKESGFKNVYLLENGLKEWNAAGKEITQK